MESFNPVLGYVSDIEFINLSPSAIIDLLTNRALGHLLELVDLPLLLGQLYVGGDELFHGGGKLFLLFL